MLKPNNVDKVANSPKVSVLITFYNQSTSVDRTISSVLNQTTNHEYEILIGDDGSDDGTWEIVLSWAHDFPSIIHAFRWSRDPSLKHEPIVRATNNRINLLKKAKGEYVVLLDGDDYFCSENKLEKQLLALKSHPKCTCCTHNTQMVMHDGTVIRYVMPESYSSTTIPLKVYWSHLYQPAESFLFKNPHIETKGINFNPLSFDDNSITFALAGEGPIYYISEPMVSYVQHEDSSWLGRDRFEQALVDLSDYFLEIGQRPSFAKYSIMKHLPSFRCAIKKAGHHKPLPYSIQYYSDNIPQFGRFIKDTQRSKLSPSGILFRTKWILKILLYGIIKVIIKQIFKLIS